MYQKMRIYFWSLMAHFPTGFVPFPGRAVDLGEGFPWYGSPDLMGEWVGNLDEAERERGVGRQKSRRFAGGWLW